MSLVRRGGLLTNNLILTIESYAVSQDDAGATVETYSTLVKKVYAIGTNFSANRTGEFGTDAQRATGTITGTNVHLGREDTRLLITSFCDRPELVGTYWRVASVVSHPAGRGGILASRITCQVELLKLPAKVS
jgi:hypothetical protein